MGQYLELGDGAVLVNDIHDVYRAAVTEGGGGHCVVSGALAGEAVCAVYGGLNAGGYESCYLSVLVHLDDTLDVLLTCSCVSLCCGSLDSLNDGSVLGSGVVKGLAADVVAECVCNVCDLVSHHCIAGAVGAYEQPVRFLNLACAGVVEGSRK